MNIHNIFGLLAGVVFAISAGWYVLDVAKKRVEVSIITFIIFTLLNISQLASLVSEGLWSTIPFTVVGLLASILICIFAFSEHKMYVKKLDVVCLVIGVIGFVAWQLSDRADINIYLITFINVIAFVPLIAKVFNDPSLETALPWRLNLLASFLLLLSVPSIGAVQLAIPVRQFICSLLLNIGLMGKKPEA